MYLLLDLYPRLRGTGSNAFPIQLLKRSIENQAGISHIQEKTGRLALLLSTMRLMWLIEQYMQ